MEIAAGSGEAPQKWGQIYQMLGDKVSGLALTLPFAVDAQQLGVQHFASLTLDQVRPGTTLMAPVSSSMETKIVPLAVPGRCRTVTMPQARASCPLR